VSIAFVGLAGGRLLVFDVVYERLFTAFLMLNGMFLLLGFVAFSDRIAAYSWILGPSLLWYPLCRLRSLPAHAAAVAVLLIAYAAGFSSGNLGVGA
jgi:hypothetical protein